MLQVDPRNRPPIAVILAQIQEIAAARNTVLKCPLALLANRPARSAATPASPARRPAETSGSWLLSVLLKGIIGSKTLYFSDGKNFSVLPP